MHTIPDSKRIIKNISTLESGFACRINQFRVDGSRIWKEKVADSKISGYMLAGPQMCRQSRCYSSSLVALLRKTILDMQRFRIRWKPTVGRKTRDKKDATSIWLLVKSSEGYWTWINVQFEKTHDNSHYVLMVHIYNLLGTNGLLIVNFIILILNISGHGKWKLNQGWLRF